MKGIDLVEGLEQRELRFGSICSGIEAASAAWEQLGWRAAWFSEIEAAPCSLLAGRYPETPNYGDMTALPERIASGEIEAPDIICGGTPCQAFSVAGKRGSLSDDRGNLSLIFCEIANATDDARRARNQPETIVFWENVPGVLNTKDNAFGCFLAGLAGEDVPLEPAGKRWTNAGCVYGPKRAIAWRVLDAQHFGLAQRRKRVFVIASARKGFDPAEILFEFEGMRRDSAPSREAGKDAAADAVSSLVSSGRRVERIGETRGQDPVVAAFRMVAFGEYADDDTASAMKARDYKDATDLAVCVTGNLTHTLKAEGFDASEDGTGRGQPIIAFPARLSGTQCASTENLTPSLGAQNPTAVAVSLRGREGGGTAELGDEIQNCLRASSGGGDKPYVLTVHGTQDPDLRTEQAHALGRNSGQENAVFAFAENSRAEVRLEGGDGSRVGAISSGGGKPGQGVPCVQQLTLVRRLMPIECERLQGFQDNWTLVNHRGKPMADGPRYKAIGNSWAVAVVRWIGARIDSYLDAERLPSPKDLAKRIDTL